MALTLESDRGARGCAKAFPDGFPTVEPFNAAQRTLLNVTAEHCFGPDSPPMRSRFDAWMALSDLVPDAAVFNSDATARWSPGLGGAARVGHDASQPSRRLAHSPLLSIGEAREQLITLQTSAYRHERASASLQRGSDDGTKRDGSQHPGRSLSAACQAGKFLDLVGACLVPGVRMFGTSVCRLVIRAR
jgi:hypothetical protein